MRKSQILYIEDDEVDIMYLKRLLKGLSDELDLKITSSFKDAQNAIQSSEIDLIITDNQLEDGYLRDHSHILKGIPFIVSSGLEEAALEQVASETGANAYLQKPIDKAILMQKIEEILGDNELGKEKENPVKAEFDLQSLLAFSGGDKSFALDMMTMLSERFPTDLSTMKKALAETDQVAIGRLAHNLKSSFLIFKHEELAKICEKIESSATNNAELADLKELISRLDKSGSEFMGHLRQVMTDLKKEEN